MESKSITTQIYCGGELYSGGESVINDLKNSGFTTVVAWAVHVNTEGGLIYNDPQIVENGKYIGNPEWPAQLESLKLGSTSVNRLIFSIGGWATSDFANIQSLINKYGIGDTNPLYQSFKVLKETIPSIDAIDFDDESLYDQKTTVSFALMLQSLGYEVTFCPYTNMSFWIDCLRTLSAEAPGLVTAFNLQCYAGGAGNNPQNWVNAIQAEMGDGFNAKDFVYPGLWCRHGEDCSQGDCPDSVESKIAAWSTSINRLSGGFVWLYSDIQSCASSGVCSAGMSTADYADAVKSGIEASSDRWIEKKDVAEYKGASWDNFVSQLALTTVADAKKMAESNDEITYFFYCNSSIIMEPNHSFDAGTAVFFKGSPWYGSAPQCDAYEKVKN